MELAKRKQNRLTEYDYSTPHAYFITICTNNRRNLFWMNTGAIIHDPKDIQLSRYGMLVEASIKEISKHYPSVSVDNYAIMPDHVHLLLQIHTDCGGHAMNAPTISTVVRLMKGSVSKQAGFSVWQKGFHDHVVRNEEDYQEIWKYITGNPLRWADESWVH